jgi:hypothetical protein
VKGKNGGSGLGKIALKPGKWGRKKKEKKCQPTEDDRAIIRAFFI